MIKTTISLIVLLTTLCYVSHAFHFPKEDYRESGATCTTADDSVGVCAAPDACSAAVRRWRAEGKNPKVCQFTGQRVNTICCARISEEKCRSYNTNSTVKNIRTKRQSEISQPETTTARTFLITAVPYVVRGFWTRLEEFPYMCALGWSENDTIVDWRCGGTLISDQFVLTAAHCTSHGGIQPNLIKIGAQNLNNLTQGSTPNTFPIARIIVHPQYSFTSHYNDIALIQLQAPVVFSSGISPICLHTDPQMASLDVTILGYGHTEFSGSRSDILLKAFLKISNNVECAPHYSTNQRMLKVGVVDSQMCAIDEGGSDSCQGDSGGPLLYNASGVYHIVGVTSFGQACSSSSPGVYTRVSSYLDWIESIVW